VSEVPPFVGRIARRDLPGASILAVVPAMLVLLLVHASSASAELGAIAAGRHGEVWFAEPSTDTIGRRTARGKIKRFRIPTPAAEPVALSLGSDGSLWFAEHRADKLGRIEPDGAVREYPIPVPPAHPIAVGPFRIAAAGPPQPGAITIGREGDVWFTFGGQDSGVSSTYGGFVARLDVEGTIVEYPLPGPNAEPQAITTGTDGTIWVTERISRGGAIGRVAPDGSIAVTPLPEGNEPRGVEPAPDGGVWFAEVVFGPQIVGVIGKLTAAGSFAYFSLPHSEQLSGIASDDEGDLWFPTYASGHVTKEPDGSLSTGPTTGVLARMDAQGHVREFVTPHDVIELAPGADGTMWFTQESSDAIGHINRSGKIVELPTKPRPRGVLIKPPASRGPIATRRAPLADPPAP
jgi:virginiamycin B lyase